MKDNPTSHQMPNFTKQRNIFIEVLIFNFKMPARPLGQPSIEWNPTLFNLCSLFRNKFFSCVCSLCHHWRSYFLNKPFICIVLNYKLNFYWFLVTGVQFVTVLYWSTFVVDYIFQPSFISGHQVLFQSFVGPLAV